MLFQFLDCAEHRLQEERPVGRPRKAPSSDSKLQFKSKEMS